MVRPARMYYDGSYEEWEEYLEKAADHARRQRAYASLAEMLQERGNLEEEISR